MIERYTRGGRGAVVEIASENSSSPAKLTFSPETAKNFLHVIQDVYPQRRGEKVLLASSWREINGPWQYQI